MKRVRGDLPDRGPYRYGTTLHVNRQRDLAGVSSGHSRREETSLVKTGKAGKDLPRRRAKHREGKKHHELS